MVICTSKQRKTRSTGRFSRFPMLRAVFLAYASLGSFTLIPALKVTVTVCQPISIFSINR